MIPIVASLLALALTIIGLIVKVTSAMSRMQVFIDELRNERRLVRQIPVLAQRMHHVEQEMGINSGSYHQFASEE